MKQYTLFGVAFVVSLLLLILTAESIWTIPLCAVSMTISFVCGQLWKEWTLVQKFKIGSVIVEVYNEELKMEEIRWCVEHAVIAGRTLEKVTLVVDKDEIEITGEYAPVPFERIRRITGYLGGKLERMNNAKQSEIKDRVSHAIVDRDLEDVLADVYTR